jgi:thymidylate synthase
MLSVSLVVDDMKQMFFDLLAKGKFVKDKSGIKMLEIINANFIADKSILFGTPALDWYEREKQWYLSQSLNVNDIPPPIPKIWQAVATPSGEINSNYGWAVFSEENYSQYDNCKKSLEQQADTRQGVMIYNRPSMQYDSKKDGRSDFMCCMFNQFFIRDEQLSMNVNFRSNDSIFGYKGDYAWMDYVHTKLHSDLILTYPNLQKGPIIWNAMSFHIYENHFDLVK